MEQQKIIHFMYVPWTGLGLYNGFRGNRWLKNRIKIFKQFVIPSLQNQTSKNFILWCSWRPEEKKNPYVQELVAYLDTIQEFKSVHTFHGLCFYDDKFEDRVAREKLIMNLHGTMGDLVNVIGERDFVYMTIQPSDDLYDGATVQAIQEFFEENQDFQALGFQKGYCINYPTKEVAEYNPNTNPPFYTIKFPRDVFVDALKHLEYTSIKNDAGKYKKGTPIPSHEYVGYAVKLATAEDRGFMVGMHGENVSTVWNHPFKGRILDEGEKGKILSYFGIFAVPKLKISYSLRKRLLRMLPFKAQRKIRYWFGERFFAKIYEFLRA